MAYRPQKYEIAGIDLFGERQDDGTIKLGPRMQVTGTRTPDNRTQVSDFPDEIEVEGVTYVLEEIRLNRVECNLSPGHPGYNIEWGVYC